MDWTFLALTLIAAILIGYIIGKGSVKFHPPPPITAISSSSSGKKSKSGRSTKSTTTITSSSTTSSAEESKSEDESKTTDESSHATTQADLASPTSSQGNTPTTRSRSSSVESADSEDADDQQQQMKFLALGGSSAGSASSVSSGGRSKRVVIVAKQLPVLTRAKYASPADRTTFTWEHPEWEDNRSFLSGLRCLREQGYRITWVGVPNTGGATVARDEQDSYEELLLTESCVPVYLSKDLSEKFFNGFCKGVLWPMLHYVLPQSNQQFSAQWDELWQAYNAANAAFSAVISRCVDSPTDTIWIHNYHLLLLPSLLRRKLPRAKIGLFIHTPFPSSDVFRVLPTRHNILSSIMAADLLGFHTFDYARHFLSCIKRVMDLDFETLPGGSLGIKYSGRFVSILISHVGIDSKMFKETREDLVAAREVGKGAVGTVEYEVNQLHQRYQSNLVNKRKMVISAGDLDSVKGGLLKFQAYYRFFETYPAMRGKVVFVEMLLPNRSVKLDHVTDLSELLKDEVEKCNKEFSDQTEYVYKPEFGDKAEWDAALAAYDRRSLVVMELKEVLPLKSTVAHYAAADVCIASQFWDGLNLMPFEYTASQMDQLNPGALIISEFMGCSRTLSGVLRVNPWNLDDVASALNVALNMTLNERIINHQRRYGYVMDHTILRWARVFLDQLDAATKLCEGMNYVQVGWGSNVKLMGLRSDFTHLEEDLVTKAYRKAERRVLLLDYDGTLTPAEKTATKSRLMGPSKQVKKLLTQLTADPQNLVFIMSGRTRSTLTEWFPSSEFPELGLAAEKGLFLRWPARLLYLCRQDLRRDPSLRRRVEMARQEKEQEFQRNAALTSAIRSQAFVQQQQQQSAASTKLISNREDESSEDDDAKTSELSSMSNGGSGGDAHLLIEEAVPVDDTEWEYMIALDDVGWKPMALDIIRSYTEQTDGSWIEDKEFAIVWHYEQADPEYGRMQASELQKYLVKILANPNVDVVRYDYNRILEVKPHGVSKGLAATAILEELFQMHNEKLRSRPPSPNGPSGGALSGIDESHDDDGRSLATGGRSPTSLDASRSTRDGSISPITHTGHARATSSTVNIFQPTSSSAAALPPFLFCVGDDRSDEDMFMSVQNKDYLEGKLRSTPHAQFLHQHSMPIILPHQDSFKRSLSAHASVSHKSVKERAAAIQAKSGDIDEKAIRERRKSRIADPFTFTVCVGMKPSNAHFYLHDDEEVVKLLMALATSSQRMAQTRAADNQALASSNGRGAAAASIGMITTSGRSLKPGDIPTSPPIPMTTQQQGQAFPSSYQQQQKQATFGSLKRQPQAPKPHSFPSHTSSSLASHPGPHTASTVDDSDENDDDDDDQDEDDDDDDDDDEAVFRQKAKQKSSFGNLSSMGR